MLEVVSPWEAVDRLKPQHEDGQEPRHTAERADREGVEGLKSSTGLNPDDNHGQEHHQTRREELVPDRKHRRAGAAPIA